jgi:2-iminobutanoate/2-iminopropanoate deaminase
MANKIRVHSERAPAAIGPYAQAVRLGDLLFCSGQIALDPGTGELVAGGIREQTARVLENIRQVLKAAGLEFSNTVKTTIFLKDMADFAAVNELYGEAFAPAGAVPPARSTLAVAALPRQALVEIEVIAVKP